MSKFDYLFKYIIIGDTSVGKSCIMLRFIEEKFKSLSDPTIGVEFGSKTIEFNDNIIKLQIWDTAGQESFRSITKSYFRGSIGAFIVFDVTEKESFNNLNNWINELINNSSKNVTYIIIGNKIDNENRIISKEEAESFCKSKNLTYIECSAKNELNINLIFKILTEKIIKKIEDGQIDPYNEIGIKVNEFENNKLNEENRTKKGCC